jgi:hypothetical protein
MDWLGQTETNGREYIPDKVKCQVGLPVGCRLYLLPEMGHRSL